MTTDPTDPKSSANATDPRLAAALEQARLLLGLATLATRNSDALDFHDISVATIRDLVRIGFEAGRAEPRKAGR